MKKPAITVLLPTFNRRKYLPRAIKSIIDQTFTNWRLIVVNDGGDDVEDIVNGFSDARIEYLNLPHKGKGGVLNVALKMVESEFVAYMDDDDEVFPEHLRLLYATAVRNNSGFVYSDTWLTRVDKNTGKVINERVENSLDVTPDMLRIQNYINHKQILHRKELSDRIGGFDEEIQILIDFDFIRRMAFVEAPHHLHQITGRHYLYMDGTSAVSISGLWQRDPDACGRSLLRIYSKTPSDLAYAYRSGVIALNRAVEQDRKIAELTRKTAALHASKDEIQKELALAQRQEADAQNKLAACRKRLTLLQGQFRVLAEQAEAMRLKNRFKRLVKWFFPRWVLSCLKGNGAKKS